MKILFMHPNLPGQYKYLCPSFAEDPNNQVVFVTKNTTVTIPNVHKVVYEVPRQASPHVHRYLYHAEQAVLQGQEVWRTLTQLKTQEGFVPDIIVAHPGWGDAMYVKDVYPDTPLFSFFEFYYHSQGADVGFDPSDPVAEDDKARVRTKNIHHLMSLTYSDWGISPTFWQHSLHPKDFQHKISVIHDGINTDVARPAKDDSELSIGLADGLNLKKGDEIVTYIARNFEPYRGFPTFMQAAEIILKERPNCHIIAIGADDVSYGKRPANNMTYRQIWSQKVKLDPKRIHFVGNQSYANLIRILQLSAAHIYLTYPFVLSWSSMESMACGCAVIGSDTQPVQEVITHGKTGFLVDFFSPEAVANQVFEILDHPTRMQHVRDAARQSIIDKYDLKKLIPLHKQLIVDVAEGKVPPPTHNKIMSLYDQSKEEAA